MNEELQLGIVIGSALTLGGMCGTCFYKRLQWVKERLRK